MSSKFASPTPDEYVVRHSITSCLFGALPRTAVKMPLPGPNVVRLSQRTEIERARVLPGRQVLSEWVLSERNWTFPSELTFARA